MKSFNLPLGASLARLSESWKTAILMCVQALLIAACLFVYLDGFRRDFRVPLTFESDGLQAIMQSKSTVDNGWWWFNPMLGAPFGLDALAFPANNNIDQAVVWAVSRPTRNAVAAINGAWLLMLVLGGLSATWCLRT